jgi:molecular chaperone GrpE
MSDEKAPDDMTPDGAPEPTDPHAAAEPSVPPPADPLEAAQAEAAKMKDQLLRLAADFDNFKKRSRRELEDATKRARDDALRDLLPVFDNLERATAHANTTTDAKALADGIGMVMRQFVDTLSKMGIQRIAAMGQAFDPAVHEAVQHLETTEHPPGSVAMELQAGYRTAERVLRPAMVVVAKAPPN